jgi:WD40 repeat protein
LAFSPNGSILASGGATDHVRLWEIGTGREQATIGTDREYNKTAVFSPGGQTLIMIEGEGNIRRWDVSRCRITHRNLASVGQLEDSSFFLSPNLRAVRL